ncbi:hypothetical protein [Granulicella sp. WH15]|uniref:hypothetical protein n=1 Tax=Granulicella sp. WH15 TaxID=2602070 RepID=UPI0013A59DEA|nr:hypothetical protein [Granulicella sp. WH15]
MASELNSIENDWQALAWAFGGVRVLFSIQPSPLRSVADLDEEARKHAKRRLHAMNNGWLGTNVPLLVPIISCLSPILGIAMSRNIPGNAAQLAGYLLLIPMLYLRTREPDVPDRDDQPNLVRFYANEMSALSRNSLSFWMFLAGVLLLTCGWELEFARGLVGIGIISFFSLVMLALFLAKHVNDRRRFAQIEALLGRLPSY